MKIKEYKTTIIDTGQGGEIDRLKLRAFVRFTERFFEDEANAKAFEEYQAEKHRKEQATA